MKKNTRPPGYYILYILKVNKKTLLALLSILLFQVNINAQNTNMLIVPSSTVMGIGEHFTVNVAVDFKTADSLNGAEVHLIFDNTRLMVDSITKPAGDLLPVEAISIEPVDSINVKGQINYAATTTGNYPSKDFNLLTIYFTVIGVSDTATSLTLLTSFPDKSNLARNGYSILDSLVNCSILNFCRPPTAIITATSACDASGVSLNLDSATGIAPYSLVINGTTYTDVTRGSTFANILLPTYKIWPSDPIPGSATNNDGQAVQVGVKFRSTVPGYIKGLRFYNGDDNSGTYVVKLWNYDKFSLLATADANDVTTNAWQEVTLPSPVSIDANTTYIASYYSSAGNYADDDNYFAGGGVTSGPLTALKNGVSGANSVYVYGRSFPNYTWKAANYWVDVIFSPDTSTFYLTNVTDSLGCSSSDTLQVLNVTSAACTSGRSVNSPDVPTTPLPEIVRGHDIRKIYSLGQNFPNPFNNQTSIRYSLPSTERVIITLFDMDGRLVRILVNSSKEAGSHIISLNKENFAKGIYYYKMHAGSFEAVKKLVIQ